VGRESANIRMAFRISKNYLGIDNIYGNRVRWECRDGTGEDPLREIPSLTGGYRHTQKVLHIDMFIYNEHRVAVLGRLEGTEDQFVRCAVEHCHDRYVLLLPFRSD
jgi:hypothetical protein